MIVVIIVMENGGLYFVKFVGFKILMNEYVEGFVEMIELVKVVC